MDIATIQRRIRLIEEAESQIKAAREALKGELEESEPYQLANKEAKEALQKRKKLKDELYNQPHTQKIRDDIRANLEEIATLSEILSAELFEFYQAENVDQVLGEDGQPRKFKIMAKLLRKEWNNQN